MLSYKKAYAIIEKALAGYSLKKEPAQLYEPIEYILAIGGKRIRPALCLMSYRMFAENTDEAIPAALAVEIFHNFTLLHDDVMDNAPIRRNNPTVHSKWNLNTAILSGDAMMILAYATLQKIKADVFPKVFELFTTTSLEVCEGQQYDMDFEDRQDVSVEEYLEMIRLKTAVLIASSLAIGGIVAGAKLEDVQALYSCGLNLGIAFQLQDDYLDVFSSESHFGKTRGGDIVANKKTFLLISALNSTNRELRNELQNWLAEKETNNEAKIDAVTFIYRKLKIDKKTQELAENYFELAKQALDSISVPTEKTLELHKLFRDLMAREK